MRSNQYKAKLDFGILNAIFCEGISRDTRFFNEACYGLKKTKDQIQVQCVTAIIKAATLKQPKLKAKAG